MLPFGVTPYTTMEMGHQASYVASRLLGVPYCGHILSHSINSRSTPRRRSIYAFGNGFLDRPGIVFLGLAQGGKRSA